MSSQHLRGGAPLPVGPYPLLPLRSGALFPSVTQTFSVGRKKSITLIHSLHVGDIVVVVPQRSPKPKQPKAEDLFSHGTFARVVQTVRLSDASYQLGLEGIGRFSLSKLVQTEPYYKATGSLIADVDESPRETRLLAEALLSQVTDVQRGGGALGDVPVLEEDVASFVDRVAAGLELSVDQAAELLAEPDVGGRVRRVLSLLSEIRTTAELRSKIANDVRTQFGKQQRDAILREQLKAIKKELGDDDNSSDAGLRKRLDEAEFPEDVQVVVDRELRRLDTTGQSAEGNVIRTYLDWIAALPWAKRVPVNDDIDAISEQLERDHFGMDDVKKRILEHMAVYKLSGNPRGTILALVGPPGVGKTSLGQSIAEATGRPLVRIALGGVRDEAEVRGHRRTYVGALPGRVIHALRKAAVKNPIVLLDELDKLGTGWGGSPESALLEVLDPEQNKNFTDHYLELPFDLSEVMFIATANSLDTLSAPLRDRLEIVELSGYTEAEKTEIARRHLLAKRARDAGIPDGVLNISNAALAQVIADYTREAGVRQLDRELMRIGRKVALAVARRGEGDDAPLKINIEPENLSEYLGKPRFHSDVAERTSIAGVATGLAWTPVGGDILFVETTRMPGKGRLEITGKLGDVMKESARAALSYTRSHAVELGINPEDLDKHDIHLHVPAGAVPKDGPSAGVTIFTALASLLTNRRVRSDTAMTGECTLRGRVLPVGGIKAKVLAAHRAGIRRIVLPEKNQRDLDDVPQSIRDDLSFVLVADMSEVLKATLEDLPISVTPGPGFLGVSVSTDAVHPEI